MTFFGKLIFVSASWCPVYLLIGALAWTTNQPVAIGLIGLAAISFVLLWMVKHHIERRFASEFVTLGSCEAQKDDIFMYILTYIPPFFATDLTSAAKIVALVLLYSFIFITYVRLDQYHLNPLFVFFGYRVFRAETTNKRRLHVIAKGDQPIVEGQQIRVAIFANLALAVPDREATNAR